MTKKHFIAIAAILKAHKADSNLVHSLAAAFANLNPNFDATKFINACIGETK